MPRLLSTPQVCLGENAKEEMNLVEVLPPAGREDKKTKPVTIASLQASVLPMVSLALQAWEHCVPWPREALLCPRPWVGCTQTGRSSLQTRSGAGEPVEPALKAQAPDADSRAPAPPTLHQLCNLGQAK